MTKEELKKEAKEWLSITDNHLNDERTHFLSESEYAEQAYLAGAEPREKQIQIDAEQIRALQKQNGELTDKVKELKAQIEKMKSCHNCKKCVYEECEIICRTYDCINNNKWEIKEK